MRDDNFRELKDFVKNHKLSDENSNIHFKALVSIKTVQNKIVNEEMEVRVFFLGYDNSGTLSLFAHHLDPLLYPTNFVAKWQKMEHIDNAHLYISDMHRKNPDIGKYEVKIIPLRKISE